MGAANLEPPRFEDRRSSFWVTFRNHTLMSPDSVNWLNQFSDRSMNDHQRLALAYLRHALDARPRFIAYSIKDLPAAIPVAARKVFGLAFYQGESL